MHEITNILKKYGFDDKIIKHIKPYNFKKQLEKIQTLTQEEITNINNYLLTIENQEMIFPLFYASICKIDIKEFINEFNPDSLIFITELIDEKIYKKDDIKWKKSYLRIQSMDDTKFQILKKLQLTEVKDIDADHVEKLSQHIDKPYFNLLMDIKSTSYKLADMIKFYSLNDSLNEKICILGTSIENVIRREQNTEIIRYIYEKFDVIRQIGWKNFISINFTQFDRHELQVIFDNLTVDNFHYLLNYSGNIYELLLHLIVNDDSIKQHLMKYLDKFKQLYTIYDVEKQIRNAFILYKYSKPFDFVFSNSLNDDLKDIVTQLLLKGYSYELVLSNKFLNCFKKHKYRDKLQKQFNLGINILLYYGFEKKQLAEAIKVIEDKQIKIETIDKMINNFLNIEKDIAKKKELLSYLRCFSDKEKKKIFYPFVLTFISKDIRINKDIHKSLFLIICHHFHLYSINGYGYSKINLFKEFLNI
ncbi:MAG: hypothetical protein N2505_00370 [Endomicrobia bacterium]|nr:hypothetical protein [Endomicrobiia bacterium]